MRATRLPRAGGSRRSHHAFASRGESHLVRRGSVGDDAEESLVRLASAELRLRRAEDGASTEEDRDDAAEGRGRVGEKREVPSDVLGAEGDAGVDVELGHGHAGGVDAVDAPCAAEGGRAAGEAAERGEGLGGHLDGDAVAADESVALGGEEEGARAEDEGGEEEGEEARGGPIARPARQADRLARLLVRRQGGVAPAVPATRGRGRLSAPDLNHDEGAGAGCAGRDRETHQGGTHARAAKAKPKNAKVRARENILFPARPSHCAVRRVRRYVNFIVGNSTWKRVQYPTDRRPFVHRRGRSLAPASPAWDKNERPAGTGYPVRVRLAS